MALVLGIMALTRPLTMQTPDGRRHAIIGVSTGVATLLLCCVIFALAGVAGSNSNRSSLSDSTYATASQMPFRPFDRAIAIIGRNIGNTKTSYTCCRRPEIISQRPLRKMYELYEEHICLTI